MKELVETCKSDSYKKGVFMVELVDDNLHLWDVKLFNPILGTGLHDDLARLREKGKLDYIQLRVRFPKNYPYEPPLVRVAYPVMDGSGTGALCMHLLNPQGWIPECTGEALILTIIDHQLFCKNRVYFGHEETRPAGYTEEEAFKERTTSLKDHGWQYARASKLGKNS